MMILCGLHLQDTLFPEKGSLGFCCLIVRKLKGGVDFDATKVDILVYNGNMLAIFF